MIEKDQEGHSAEGDATDVTTDEMNQALDSIKSASPGLAGKIDAAGVTPETLAGSHDRATDESPERG